MTNIEKLNIVLEDYVGADEIKLLAGVGINKAREIRKEINTKYCKKMLLPSNKIPTKYLLKELGLTIDEIFLKAKKEMELKEVK